MFPSLLLISGDEGVVVMIEDFLLNLACAFLDFSQWRCRDDGIRELLALEVTVRVIEDDTI